MGPPVQLSNPCTRHNNRLTKASPDLDPRCILARTLSLHDGLDLAKLMNFRCLLVALANTVSARLTRISKGDFRSNQRVFTPGDLPFGSWNPRRALRSNPLSGSTD